MRRAAPIRAGNHDHEDPHHNPVHDGRIASGHADSEAWIRVEAEEEEAEWHG